MKKRITSTVKMASMLFLLTFLSYNIFAQSPSNYVFSTNTTGSLVLDKNANPIDMSTGTTLLIGPNLNSVNTVLLDIGFDFTYNGVRVNKYNVTSHGLIGLFTNTGTALSTGNSIGGGASNRLGALVMALVGTNMATHATGKVHSKVVGTFPNRILVIEWLNMSIPSTSTSADATFQARLYEAGSTIEYVYGSMSTNLSATTGSIKVGFATNTTAGTANTVDFASTPPLGNTTTAAGFSNNLNAGIIPNLNSTTNGSRRVFTFNPPTVAAPTNLSFSPIGAGSMTLNWTDNSTNEVGYIIYRSDDGGATYNVAGTTAANAISYIGIGLLPTTNYFWRVAAYAEGRSDFASSNATTTGVGGSITSTSTGGLWSQTATWVGGIVPSGNNEVVITDGATVTIDVDATAYNLTVGQGMSGSLIFEATNARNLTVSNNLTINTGGTLASAGTGAVTTHVVNVFNNVANNGTLDLSTSSNLAGAELRFLGSNSATYSGTGATNDMFLLTINKNVPSGIVSTSSPTVEISVSAMTGKGSTATFVGVSPMSGILKFSGTNTFASVLFPSASYTIPITGGFWLNNPNMSVSAQSGSPIWNGLLRVSAGTFNHGTIAGNQMSGGAGATYIFEGGVSNFSGRFLNASAVTFTMTGGIINACTVGNAGTTTSFGLTSASNIVTISGGTINLVKPSTGTTKLDYNVAGTATITGGTLNVNGTAASTYNIAGSTPNIVVNNTCIAKLTAQTNIYGDLTVATGSSFDAATFTTILFGQNITKPGNIINTGTIINSAPTTAGTNNANRLSFNGTFGGQTVSGSGGSIGNATTTFSGISISNAAGVSFSQPVFTNRINLFTGTITNANNITLGNGYATPVLAVVQVGGTATVAQGSMGSSAPTFSVTTSGLSLLYSAGTSNTTTGTEIPSTRTVNFFTVSNAVLNSVTLDGGDLAVTGTLAFSAGNLFLGSNSITAAAISGGSVTSHAITNSTGYLKAPVSTTPITFPMGANATMYDPVVLTENGGSSNTYGVKVTNGAVINNPTDPTKTINKNWEISKFTMASSNVNATLTYDAATTVGANFNPSGAVVVGHWSSTTSKWEEFSATLTANTAAINGITSFSPFAVANAGALPIELLSFTGKKVGKAVQLDWATASENNNAKFDIERSADGKNFQRIASKLSNGDAKILTNYSYQDFSAPNSSLYYRLKQIDNDGRFTYSPIISINNQNSKDAISVYPNPVKEVLYFTTENQDQPIYIYDLKGALLKKMDNVPSSLSIDDLKNGIYILKTSSQTIKFVKE